MEIAITIRDIEIEEYPLLEDYLYLAIYQEEGQGPYPREIVYDPSIYAYIDSFGCRDSDIALIAACDDKPIGAVWVRIIAGENKGYGNIDDFTPELAISVLPQYRNLGVGKKLMLAIIDRLKQMGYSKTSLSVHKSNFAVKLYKSVGFEILKDQEKDYVMVLDIK